MISFISSFEITNGVRFGKSEGCTPDPNISFQISSTAFVADASAANSDGIKMFLAYGLSISFINGNPVFSNCPKRLPKNPPDCPILCNWVFDNYILVEKVFAKALRSLKTCM